MHVAIIDGDVAYPADSGKRLRTLNLMLRLAADHRITYIARSHTSAHSVKAAAFFADHDIASVFVEEPVAIKKGPLFYGRLAQNFFSPFPYSVVSHRSAAMRKAVARHAAEKPIDIWQLEWSAYHYTVADQKQPIVLQAHNVDALIWQRYSEHEMNPAKRWYARHQWRKFRAFERQVFRAATRIVAVSEEDAFFAREHYGELAIDVVDNGVDCSAFAHLHPDAGAKTILFLGALDWRPNLDAALVLLDSIFPLVKARVSDAKLAIVGRSPPGWLRARAQSTEGVVLAADVLDVRPYIAASSVMAVPLRIGGGSRLKILEALASGLPVVSSSVGAEGLDLKHGSELTIVNSANEAAAALVECLTNPLPALQQAERGRSTVAERYDWGLLAARLGMVWERARQTHRKSG
jgi:polysaccharide biosynthesis protein PslH